MPAVAAALAGGLGLVAWRREEVWACWPRADGTACQVFEQVWPPVSSPDGDANCRPRTAAFSGPRELWLGCDGGRVVGVVRGHPQPMTTAPPDLATPRRPSMACLSHARARVVWDEGPGKPRLVPCDAGDGRPRCGALHDAVASIRTPRGAAVRVRVSLAADVSTGARTAAHALQRRAGAAHAIWLGVMIGFDPRRARQARAQAWALRQRAASLALAGGCP